MKIKFAAALAVAAVSLPVVIPTAAEAQRRDNRWQGDGNRRDWNPQDSYRSGKYKERSLGRNDRVYKGRDNRYYCKRNDGTTGLVIGALGGGVLGNVVGGGTLGTLLGAAGGGLLGRSVDRGNVKCR